MSAAPDRIADPIRFASDLAGFLTALQRVDAAGGPQPGIHNWYRGGTLRTYDTNTAEGNLLLQDGQLAAVIDFGTCGVGDPACDLAVAWTLLTADGRHKFREQLAVDGSTWARGRGWALWKTLATCSYTYADPQDAREFATAKHILDRIFAEYLDSMDGRKSTRNRSPQR